jgi:hypothetical protein
MDFELLRSYDNRTEVINRKTYCCGLDIQLFLKIREEIPELLRLVRGNKQHLLMQRPASAFAYELPGTCR